MLVSSLMVETCLVTAADVDNLGWKMKLVVTLFAQGQFFWKFDMSLPEHMVRSFFFFINNPPIFALLLRIKIMVLVGKLKNSSKSKTISRSEIKHYTNHSPLWGCQTIALRFSQPLCCHLPTGLGTRHLRRSWKCTEDPQSSTRCRHCGPKIKPKNILVLINVKKVKDSANNSYVFRILREKMELSKFRKQARCQILSFPRKVTLFLQNKGRCRSA